jgi:hypothetical protein
MEISMRQANVKRGRKSAAKLAKPWYFTRV